MRSFIGLPVAASATQVLTNLQSGLASTRWVLPDDFHITLAFLGDIRPEQFKELDFQLSQLLLNEIEILIDGLGCFERVGQTQTVWAGVSASAELQDCADQVRRCCALADIDYDRARFKPHVTLGRFAKRPVANLTSWIDQRSSLARADFWCSEMVVYKSTLTPDGARYARAAEYPLKTYEDIYWEQEP